MYCAKCKQSKSHKSLLKQLYFHISFCLQAIRPWHNLSAGGHGHVIRMLVGAYVGLGAFCGCLHITGLNCLYISQIELVIYHILNGLYIYQIELL